MGEMADYYRDISQEYYQEYIEPNLILHTCENGKIVCVNGTHSKYPIMTNDHLKNTIKWIERKARQGIFIECGYMPPDIEMIAETVEIFGEDVLRHMNYQDYKNEAKKRKI